MSEKDVVTYPGKSIDVMWDARLCLHIGECTRAQGDLFVAGRQPWCQPDLVASEEVVDVVERCPSGALTYQPKDNTAAETADKVNTIVVTYNGPLFVRGDLEIDGVSPGQPGVAYRAALCRCGHSQAKPFCDNSHERVNFKDSGAVGERGQGLGMRSGKLKIKPLQDGPLQLTGNVTITASSGRVAWQGASVALCRCGASHNKPFCDGSHKALGFRSG